MSRFSKALRGVFPSLPRKRKTTPDARAAWRERDYFQRAAARNIDGIPDARCFVLQNVIRSLDLVPGDVAECGVRYGKSSLFLMEANQAPRAFHLFDSFEGVSDPTAEDAVPRTGRAHWRKNDLAVSEEAVRNNLKAFPDVRLYRGWIPARFDEVADRSFALVHVDVDLYEPTLATLDFFWPRLVRDGMVVCDDYGSPRCPGAKRAMDEFFAGKPVKFMELPTMQVLVTKLA